MFGNINKKKLAGAILAGVLTVTGATSAFAADQAGNSQQIVNQNKPVRVDLSKMSATIKSAMDSLVAAGTITQAQADIVAKEYTPGDKKGYSMKFKKSPMDELVTAGTITQVQSDAISTAIKSGRKSKKTIEAILKDLVSVGTISSEQKDAVMNTFPIRDAVSKPIIINKTQLDGLVTSGVLTQTQADAVAKLDLAGIRDNNPNAGKGNLQRDIRKEPLSQLVAAGTITQAQADAINTAIKSALQVLDKQ
jgi:hypothetical protein